MTSPRRPLDCQLQNEDAIVTLSVRDQKSGDYFVLGLPTRSAAALCAQLLCTVHAPDEDWDSECAIHGALTVGKKSAT